MQSPASDRGTSGKWRSRLPAAGQPSNAPGRAGDLLPGGLLLVGAGPERHSPGGAATRPRATVTFGRHCNLVSLGVDEHSVAVRHRRPSAATSEDRIWDGLSLYRRAIRGVWAVAVSRGVGREEGWHRAVATRHGRSSLTSTRWNVAMCGSKPDFPTLRIV